MATKADRDDGDGDNSGDNHSEATIVKGGVSIVEKDSLPGTGSPWGKTQAVEPSQPSEAVNGEVSIQIPDEILADPLPLWRCYVVGYFIGDAPHVGSIHATVNRIWSTPKMGTKIDVQFLDKTTVLFRIENPQMRTRVIQRCYWHIADIPLVVNEWSPETALQPPDLSAMPIWIDLKGVPSLLFSHKALKCLSQAAGNFVKLHPHTEKCTRLDVARILVEVNLNKPLVEKISCLDRDGKGVLIEVLYPWLPPKCNICNRWGHLGSSCKSKMISVMQKSKEVALEKGTLDADKTGEGSARDDLKNTKRNVVQELLHELEGIPLTCGNNDVGGVKRKDLEVGDTSITDRSEQRKEEWALVGRPDSAEKRNLVGEGHKSDVLISPSRFSILALDEQAEVENDDKDEDSNDEKNEDSSDEKGDDVKVNVDLDVEEGELGDKNEEKEEDINDEKREDVNVDLDVEEGELVTKVEDLKAKDQNKTARVRNGTSLKLSKQVPARAKDLRGKNQSTKRKTSSRKL